MSDDSNERSTDADEEHDAAGSNDHADREDGNVFEDDCERDDRRPHGRQGLEARQRRRQGCRDCECDEYQTAVPAVVAVLAYVINALAPLVSWLEPVRRFSPFFQYSGHDPLRSGASIPAILVTAVSTLVFTAAAATAFQRRDVGT